MLLFCKAAVVLVVSIVPAQWSARVLAGLTVLVVVPVGRSTEQLLQLLGGRNAPRQLGQALVESRKLLAADASLVRKLEIAKPTLRPGASLSGLLSRARRVTKRFGKLLAQPAPPTKQVGFGDQSVDFCHGALRMLHSREMISEVDAFTAAPAGNSERHRRTPVDSQCMDLDALGGPAGGLDALLDAQQGETRAAPEDGQKDLVHVRVQQRNGRKCITTVQGLNQQLDLKKILKAIKKSKCCNGTVVEDDEMGQVLQFQGDQRDACVSFLVENELVTKDKIKKHGQG